MSAWSVSTLVSIIRLMVWIYGSLAFMLLNTMLETWIIVGNWSIMKLPWNLTAFPSTSSSVIPSALKNLVTKWKILNLVCFSFITMKSIKYVIEQIWWLALFSNRSLNVASISVIQLEIPSGGVASALLIALVAMKFLSGRGGLRWGGGLQAGCAVRALPLGVSVDGGASLVSMLSVVR